MTALHWTIVSQPGIPPAREYDTEVIPQSASGASRQVPLSAMQLEELWQKESSPSTEVVPIDRHPSAFQDRVEIGSLLDTRLRMRGALTLEMEQEGEFYIAKCDELNEMGYDYDPIGAVQDVRVTIAELYWGLKENQDCLGPDLAEVV